MDDSFSWADTVDVWNGVEGLPEENTEQSEKVLKKKQRRKESVEDHLNEEEEEPYLVQGPDPDQDEDDEEDEEGIGKGSVQKAVLFILIGCLAVVLIIMLIVAFKLMGNDNRSESVNGIVTSSSTAGSVANSVRETLEITKEESVSTEEITRETTERTTEESISTTEESASTEETTPQTTEESISTSEATTPSESIGDSVVIQNGISYQIQNGTATLTDAKSVGGAVSIPQQINGAPVQFIADGAFQGNTAVSRIVIPEGVITVGTNAFYGCSSLTEVVVPDSVRLIGEGAFNYCPTFVIYCNPGTYAAEFCSRWNVESRPLN